MGEGDEMELNLGGIQEFFFGTFKMSSKYSWDFVARNNHQPRAVGKN
jgi:hypothetical protein